MTLIDKVKAMMGTAQRIVDAVEEWTSLVLPDGEEPYLTGEDKLTAFKKTLATDVYPYGWEAAEASFDHWQEQIGSLKRFIRDLTKDLLDDPKELQELIPWFVAVHKAYQSNFYPALFQKKSSILKEHKILQKAIFQRLRKTEKAYLAMLPEECQVDDSIVLFIGSKTPFVVRRQSESWQFISDCYVHSVIDRES